MKQIIYNNKDTAIPEWLVKEVDGSKLIAKILLERGLNTPGKVKEFLNPEFYQPTDPFSFPAIEQAVAAILAAVEVDKKICIYGDYDVDGITATVILVNLLKKIGGRVSYHIPDRFKEGYGLNKEVISEIAFSADLLITCDCGIANYEEVALAKELGLEVIVTDHHQLPDRLPPADIILTAKFLSENHKAYHLPGAGMAYFLTAALLKTIGREDELKDFLDLVALAVVADVVPLLGENRYLLQIGLPVLARTERIGLLELYKVSGIDSTSLSEDDIAYKIAPLINSAGRIKHAELAVELLLTTDPREARRRAAKLVEINGRRKELQDRTIEEARALLSEESRREPIILYQPHWHAGVIGIAAGRLCDDYQVPVVMMCLKEDGITITGSARSVPGVHIFKGLKKCSGFLEGFGGHAGAAGFSLSRDNLTGFRKNLGSVLKKEIDKLPTEQFIRVDGELSLEEVDITTYNNLQRLAPFGEENPRPKFIAYGTEVIYSRSTRNNRHLRLLLRQNGFQHQAIWWWAGEKSLSKEVDLVYQIDLNDFRGKKQVQLLVEEIIDSKVSQIAENEEKRIVFHLIDERGVRLTNKKLIGFDEPICFYEGLKEVEGLETINRYQLKKGRTLVLLSCPPSLAVFQEIVLAVAPEEVVLSFVENEEENCFIQNLCGLVKYALNHKNGLLTLYQLAVMLGEREATVSAGLNYLAAKDFITIDYLDPVRLVVGRGKEKRKRAGMEEKLLCDLINETRAFRRFIAKAKLEMIKQLLLS